MKKLEELEKKYKELGEEIERLKKEEDVFEPNLGVYEIVGSYVYKDPAVRVVVYSNGRKFEMDPGQYDSMMRWPTKEQAEAARDRNYVRNLIDQMAAKLQNGEVGGRVAVYLHDGLWDYVVSRRGEIGAVFESIENAQKAIKWLNNMNIGLKGYSNQ